MTRGETLDQSSLDLHLVSLHQSPNDKAIVPILSSNVCTMNAFFHLIQARSVKTSDFCLPLRLCWQRLSVPSSHVSMCSTLSCT